MQRHKLACINHRAAPCMTVKGFFSVKCYVAKRVTTTLVHYIPLPKNEMVLDCTLVDIQTGHMRTFKLTSVKIKITIVNLKASFFYQALRRPLH